MGRKTFESIGKPLPGRETVVVTRDPDFFAGAPPAHAHVAGDFGGAQKRANELAMGLHCAEIIVAGGAEIYRQALPLARFLRLTRVDCAPQADAFFPEVDWSQWRELRRETPIRAEKDEFGLEYVDYGRV